MVSNDSPPHAPREPDDPAIVTRPQATAQPTDSPDTPRPRLPDTIDTLADATPDDADTNPPTVVSTFCGPGGSSLGYEYAGYDVRAAIDYAPDGFSDAIPDTYRANHPDTPFLERDIADLDADTILDAAGLDRGDLDVLDGSPPCSPFSGANSRLDWGSHGSATLFDDYARLVDALEPRAFVAENVPGLAEGKTKRYFAYLCNRLRDAGPGYTLTVFRFDATALGAGHHRRRLLFIGTRRDQPDPPTLGPSTVYQPRRVADSWMHVAAENTTADLQTATDRLRRSENYHAYTRIQPGETLADVTDGTGWSHYRLRPGDPAPTFTSTHKTLPPTANREITIPELKRLIGIPDAYDLVTDNGYATQWELCIRCLPPELLETIGRALRASVLSPDAFTADTVTPDAFTDPHTAARRMVAQQHR